MHNGDTTVLSSLLNMLSTHLIYGALSDNQQDSIMFYEIHVCGKNAFSTSIVSVGELDDDDIIMLGYEQDKLEGDDCHHIDYINELTFDEWNTQFNH